jgi:hypothetical protein
MMTVLVEVNSLALVLSSVCFWVGSRVVARRYASGEGGRI